MFKGVFKSDFARQVTVLFAGSAFAQILPFLLLPILQRYFYTPEDFGVLSLYIVLADLIGKVGMFKLELGLVMHRKMKDASNLLFGALRLSIIVFIICFILMLVGKQWLASYFDVDKNNWILFLLPIYILLISLSELGNYWFNRSQQFKLISYGRVFQTSIAETLKIIFGFLSVFNGLIFARISGFFSIAVFYIATFFVRDKKYLRLWNNTHRKKIVGKNKDFIFYSTPSVFISNAINFLYINLFLVYFSKEVVGFVSVSNMYLSAGFGLLASAYSQVFYSKIAGIDSKQEMKSLYLKSIKGLTIMAMAVILLVQLFPASLISYFLGEQWVQMVDVMKITSWWLGGWFVASSLSFIYIRLGKQRTMLIYDGIHLIMIVLGIVLGYLFSSTIHGTLWGFVIAQLIYYIYVIFLAIRFIKKSSNLND